MGPIFNHLPHPRGFSTLYLCQPPPEGLHLRGESADPAGTPFPRGIPRVLTSGPSPERNDMIETILVATDGSDDASAAEQTAMGLASRLGARLSGVSVLDERLVRAPSADALALPPFPEADLTA